MIETSAFILAFGCVGLMGYAIQRGATCTVVAVAELVNRRRAARFIAILEAALWVAGGLMLAGTLRMMPPAPPNYAVTGLTIAGGALLGLGAWVNGGCVFGAIARLGSGELAFLLTPLGYFLGAKGVTQFVAATYPLAGPPPPFRVDLPAIALLALTGYALWRMRRALTSYVVADGNRLRRIWAPHEATLVIGIAFVIAMLSVGPWSYPELLADLAGGRFAEIDWRLALFAALLAGAALGGHHVGRARWTMPTLRGGVACMVGGALMGIGALLIPGGNDGLLLVGLPFLLPYALVALAAMCGTIALAILAQRMVNAVN